MKPSANNRMVTPEEKRQFPDRLIAPNGNVCQVIVQSPESVTLSSGNRTFTVHPRELANYKPAASE